VRLWRISEHADLTGEGGRIVAGRWHSRGRAVVYLAEHPALALLERLVHLEIDPDDLPRTYQLVEVEVPDGTPIEAVGVGRLDKANAAWREDVTVTRDIGDEWLKAARTALVRVPSVILPKSTNVLLNPAHPDTSKAAIVEVTQPAYDPRLFESSNAAKR
jgi:RES domain-containing protein